MTECGRYTSNADWKREAVRIHVLERLMQQSRYVFSKKHGIAHIGFAEFGRIVERSMNQIRLT